VTLKVEENLLKKNQKKKLRKRRGHPSHKYSETSSNYFRESNRDAVKKEKKWWPIRD
jgi:hypothetical protein